MYRECHNFHHSLATWLNGRLAPYDDILRYKRGPFNCHLNKCEIYSVLWSYCRCLQGERQNLYTIMHCLFAIRMRVCRRCNAMEWYLCHAVDQYYNKCSVIAVKVFGYIRVFPLVHSYADTCIDLAVGSSDCRLRVGHIFSGSVS